MAYWGNPVQERGTKNPVQEISTTPIIQEFHWSQWAWRSKRKAFTSPKHSIGSGSSVPESLQWWEGQLYVRVGQ